MGKLNFAFFVFFCLFFDLCYSVWFLFCFILFPSVLFGVPVFFFFIFVFSFFFLFSPILFLFISLLSFSKGSIDTDRSN